MAAALHDSQAGSRLWLGWQSAAWVDVISYVPVSGPTVVYNIDPIS